MVCSEVDVMQVQYIGRGNIYHNVAAKVLVDGVLRNVPIDKMSKRNVYTPTKNTSWR